MKEELSKILIDVDKINTSIIKLSNKDEVLNMNRAAQNLLRISDSKKTLLNYQTFSQSQLRSLQS